MSDWQLDFQYVSPEELREHWAKVREGLSQVEKKAPAYWIPEDVYMALKAGHSTLHLAYCEGEYVGFMVLTPDHGYKETTLNVWIAYCSKNGFDVMREGIVEINRLARIIKAKAITFESPRTGWEKTALKLGWKPVMVKYAQEVNYE